MSRITRRQVVQGATVTMALGTPSVHAQNGGQSLRFVAQADLKVQDDPAKRRIRAWLRELDDEQLSSIGLTREDINVPLSSFVQAQRLARGARFRHQSLRARHHAQVCGVASRSRNIEHPAGARPSR